MKTSQTNWKAVDTMEDKDINLSGNPEVTPEQFSKAVLRKKLQPVTKSQITTLQVEDSHDSKALEGFGINDFVSDSVTAYRQLYKSIQPNHPWNQHDNQVFLNCIGAWARDRKKDYSGPTKAGLLMFGKMHSTLAAFPNYTLDYQERSGEATETEWVDRFTLDETWSGNLFDFYLHVIRKLTVGLKAPTSFAYNYHQDDTSTYTALREALTNTLIHADYTERSPVLVVKQPRMFSFRNSGSMRIPADLAIRGGNSDCRNRLVQDMFRFINLGTHTGAGLPKIFRAWNNQQWKRPTLCEVFSPTEQTLLELHMVDQDKADK